MQDLLDASTDLPDVTFADGDWLIREGSPPGTLFVLLSGEVVVTKGDIEVARTAEPGSIFGEISALLDMPYTASVRALGPVRVRRSEAAADFISSHPVIALHTARLLARRLYAATAYLADVKEQFAEQADHFGIMDRVLESLMQRQGPQALPPQERSDPRL